MDSAKSQARLAGALYLMVVVTAPIGLVYVPSRLIVAGDAASTADHIRQLEGFVRLGIGSELFHQAVEVFLVLALYSLFRTVSLPRAREMAILGLIPIPIVFLNVLNEIAALTLATGANFFSVIERPQLDAWAMLFVQLHGQGIQVAAVFWGLWLFPFGLLVIRCGFIPKVLGALLIVAGVGYVLDSIHSLIIPGHASALGHVAPILEFGELPIVLWLVIWGARQPMG